MPAAPAVLPDFVTHCVELLSTAGTVRVNRMFGGYGFYVDGLFVAIVAYERLYLKGGPDNRARFEAEGCEPFRYSAKDNEQVSLSYWSAPADAMDSPALMAPWVRLAVQAALTARAAKAPVKRRPPKPRSTTSAATKRAAASAKKAPRRA
jgi:DNA transformation protein and related proteins